MNKKQYNFIKNNFIPAIKNLGYELQHENSELLKFSYNKILIFSFFIHKDFIQGICIYNGIEKKMFHIENLYLLDVNPRYMERLKRSTSQFYYDNIEEFIGIFNCFYDLVSRNTFSIEQNGIHLLMEKMEYNKSQYNEQHKNLSDKEKILMKVNRITDWNENVRFTESDLIL